MYESSRAGQPATNGVGPRERWLLSIATGPARLSYRPAGRYGRSAMRACGGPLAQVQADLGMFRVL